MRASVVAAVLVAAVGCQRDPVAEPAPAREPGPRPEVSRPKLPVRTPAEVDAPAEGDLSCFGEMKLFESPKWIGSIHVADLNEDGNPDVLALADVLEQDVFTTHLLVYLGDGRGGFARAGEMMPIGDMVIELAIADLNGDGHVDVAAQRYRDRDIAIFAGDGTGDLAFLRKLSTTRKPTGVIARDLDGDGDQDLVVSFYGHIQVFLGDGKGRFRGGQPMKQGRAVDGPVLVDGDGDGALDMYFLNNDDATYATVRGAGGARFDAPRVVDACGSPSFPQVADFDGDGRDDVVYACVVKDGGVRVHLSGGGDAIPVSAGAIESYAVGDFTGDGVVDIATMGREGDAFDGSTLRLHRGAGDGTFRDGSTTHVSGTLSDAVGADVNNDGRPDLVAAYWRGREPGYFAVWLAGKCR